MIIMKLLKLNNYPNENEIIFFFTLEQFINYINENEEVIITKYDCDDKEFDGIITISSDLDEDDCC